MNPIDLNHIDGMAMLKLVLGLAAALGLAQLAAKTGHEIAKGIRRHVLKTPSKLDDAAGKALANLVDLAAEAAARGDVERVMSAVLSAGALPPTVPPTPRPAPPGIPRA